MTSWQLHKKSGAQHQGINTIIIALVLLSLDPIVKSGPHKQGHNNVLHSVTVCPQMWSNSMCVCMCVSVCVCMCICVCVCRSNAFECGGLSTSPVKMAATPISFSQQFVGNPTIFNRRIISIREMKGAVFTNVIWVAIRECYCTDHTSVASQHEFHNKIWHDSDCLELRASSLHIIHHHIRHTSIPAMISGIWSFDFSMDVQWEQDQGNYYWYYLSHMQPTHPHTHTHTHIHMYTCTHTYMHTEKNKTKASLSIKLYWLIWYQHSR